LFKHLFRFSAICARKAIYTREKFVHNEGRHEDFSIMRGFNMTLGQKIRLAAITLLVMLPMMAAQADPVVGGCQVFPLDNPWNMDVTLAPIHPNSANYIANINANGGDYVHPDFGEEPTYGIPYVTVTDAQPLVPVSFDYDDESDPGPYPIPPDAPIEGGADSDGDRHVLVINTDTCILYELYYAFPNGDPSNSWSAGSGAIWDLSSNALRPEGWTSADAAGLPIFPGLVKCDAVMADNIKHAFRFTVQRTQRAYVYPATHFASNLTGANYPPMGLRFRLKADYDISFLEGQAIPIAKALKQYGMMIADNGSNWYISGETNPDCWNDDELNGLKQIPGTAFEVVSIVSPPTAAPDIAYYDTQTPRLTWNRVAWATGYEIQVSGNSSFVDAETYSVAGNILSLPIEVPQNGIYYWRVKALGANGSWSATERFIVREL
jgi:hypothetical protein